jgi:hypothetical protein
MPRGGSNPGQRRGGRQKGTRNKATVEKALIAEQVIARAEMTGVKLAKEHLSDLLNVFAGMATYYQPSFPGMLTQNPNADEDKFEKWARLTVQCAKDLAPYQSPTFRAVVVAPAPDANQPEKRKRFTHSIFDGPNGTPIDAVEASRVYRRIVSADSRD